MGPDALLEGAVELVDAELPNTERGAVQTVVDPRNRLTVMWGQLKSEHRPNNFFAISYIYHTFVQ